MRLKRLAIGDIKTSWDQSMISSGIRLPNCTTYCLLRLWEEGIAKNPLFTYTNIYYKFPNAQLWYTYWKGNKGEKPKVGSVLVWGGNNAKYGHVAICEDILEDNGTSWKVQVSQSNYGGTYFESKVYTIQKGVKTNGVGLNYIGCCYVDLDYGQADRNTSKHQIEVVGTNVYARKSANGDKLNAMYVPIGIYNVLDTKEVNGTTWCKIGTYNGNEVWCGAYNDLPAEKQEDYKEKYEAEVKLYEALNKKFETLNNKYIKLESANSSLQAKIDKAIECLK